MGEQLTFNLLFKNEIAVDQLVIKPYISVT
jgi:hypothetical protein